MTQEKAKSWQDQLCEAAKERNLPEVKRCIENGADVNKRDSRGSGTPLTNAAFGGDEEILKHMLNLGADINLRNGQLQTPLFIACSSGHIEAAKFLIDNNAQVNTCDDGYRSPLIAAAKNGCAELVDYLLIHKADVNIRERYGKTALDWAAYNGHLDVVKVLLKYEARINCVDENKKTPLINALDGQNLDVAKYMIQKGYNVPETLQPNILLSLAQALEMIEVFIAGRNNGETLDEHCLKNILESDNWSMIKYLATKGGDSFKNSALSKATLSRRRDIFDYIMSKGGDFNKRDYNGSTPLINAVKSGDTYAIERLLAQNADVCKMGRNGKTPLSVAVETENLKLVNFLLDKGATPTIQTAFLEAIHRENFQIVKCLKEKGALINFTYKNGQTPLAKAIESRNIKITRYLIDNGADAETVVDDLKNSFLMECVAEKNLEMIKILKNLGAKLDVAGESKAVEVEHFPMVKYFVEEGVDVNSVDGNGKVPLAIAAEAQSFSISKFLIESGAKTELARKELENYSQCSEDFAILLSLSRKDSSKSVTGTENEECSKDVDKDD